MKPVFMYNHVNQSILLKINRLVHFWILYSVTITFTLFLISVDLMVGALSASFLVFAWSVVLFYTIYDLSFSFDDVIPDSSISINRFMHNLSYLLTAMVTLVITSVLTGLVRRSFPDIQLQTVYSLSIYFTVAILMTTFAIRGGVQLLYHPRYFTMDMPKNRRESLVTILHWHQWLAVLALLYPFLVLIYVVESSSSPVVILWWETTRFSALFLFPIIFLYSVFIISLHIYSGTSGLRGMFIVNLSKRYTIVYVLILIILMSGYFMTLIVEIEFGLVMILFGLLVHITLSFLINNSRSIELVSVDSMERVYKNDEFAVFKSSIL